MVGSVYDGVHDGVFRILVCLSCMVGGITKLKPLAKFSRSMVGSLNWSMLAHSQAFPTSSVAICKKRSGRSGHVDRQRVDTVANGNYSTVCTHSLIHGNYSLHVNQVSAIFSKALLNSRVQQ